MPERLRALLGEAAPVWLLTSIGAGVLATLVLAEPPGWECGQSPPPRHEAAASEFRDVAFLTLVAGVAASLIVAAYAGLRDRSRLYGGRAWTGLVVFMGLLALALLFPVTRWFLSWGAIVAAEGWALPAMVLIGLSLLAAAPMQRSARPAFTASVAAVVVTLLALLGLWARFADGGPIIC